VETCKYSEALQLASKLLKELKKIDDKALLVEVIELIAHVVVIGVSC
jgi:hypothetical protein